MAKGYSEKMMYDWSEKYKAPMTEDYHPKNAEFAGMQYGETLKYVEKRDKIQSYEAKQIQKQNYKGRYE